MDQLWAVLDAARAVRRTNRCALVLAGHQIAVSYTSPALADAFGAALSHLRAPAPPARADNGIDDEPITLDVVVGAGPLPVPLPEMPVPEPPVPGPPVSDAARFVDRFLVTSGSLQTFVAPGSPLWMLDHRTGRALCWYSELDGPLPSWERGAPLRVLFHWWGAARGLRLVHAAAVGDERGAVLIVGPGGAGKSTTALAAATAGLGYLADDYCLVQPDAAPAPQVHCLYSTGKCDARSLALVPELAGRVVCRPSASTIDGDKSVVSMADRVVLRAPILGVVVPTIVSGATEAVPVHAMRALRALAPSTMFQMPGLQSDSFTGLARLVRRLPSVELRIGAGPNAAAQSLAALLESLVAGR
jgi:hypothetical protein